MKLVNPLKKMLLKEKKILSIDLYSLTFWILITAAFPLYSGAIAINELLSYSIYISSSYFIGKWLIYGKIPFEEMPNLLKTGIQIFIGLIINASFYYFWGKSDINLAVFIGFIFLHLLYGKIIQNKQILKELTPLIPITFLLFAHDQYIFSTKIVNGVHWDNSFHAAIVESLKTNHNFFNSIFQQDLAINYPSITHIIPANIAAICSLPSQISLWGIFMPYMFYISLYTTAWFIQKTYLTIFYKNQTPPKNTNLGLIIIMLLFWGPLNITKLLKLELLDSLYFSTGYLTPGDSPGFAISLFLSSLVLIIYFFCNFNIWKNHILLIILITLIGGCKIAFALPFISFLGIFSIFKIIQNRKDYKIIAVALGSLLAILNIYIFTFSIHTKMASHFSFSGENINELILLAEKYKFSETPLPLLIIIAFAIKLFFWVGLKILLIIPLLKRIKPFNTFKHLAISISITFLIFAPLYLFYQTYALNLDNSIYRAIGHDLAQFIKTIIYIFNIGAISTILYYFHQGNNILVKYSLVGWIVLCFCSSLKNFTTEESRIKSDEKWYPEVTRDFNKSHPNKLIMSSDGVRYSGLALTANGVHPWFIFGTLESRDGYSNDLETLVRRKHLDDFLNPKLPISLRKKAGEYFLKNHVDCIVENPFCKEKINIALKDSLIQPIKGTKHFYKITIH